jgi:Xaa-Pro aminopeptidase
VSVDDNALIAQRLQRLRQVMAEALVPALLTADPFSVRYATGTRNMLVHGMTGPDRLALVRIDAATVLWEFAGCEHLSRGAPGVGDLRLAPSLSAKKAPDFHEQCAAFAREVGALLDGSSPLLAIERLDPPVTDALRAVGMELRDATTVMQEAMAIKQPAEIDAMRASMVVTERAAADMEAAVVAGRSEQEVWAEFHRSLIAGGGELIVTRLLQAGERTFPYFQEASDHRLADGDLVCFDSDTVGMHGYSVDFSRTFLCGDGEATAEQRGLYRLAREQLEFNAANLAPGRSFESFARAAFDVPEPHCEFGYYQLAHGLGLAGGHPNIPRFDGDPYPLPGDFEPGMVICIESYVGCPDTRQGVKLEDQFLITDDGVETMSTYPFDPRLSGVTPSP